MSTFVCYHIPSDRDDPEHPNAFSINTDQVTLKDIKKAFPLPGQYHFRFRTPSNTFWTDCTDDAAIVPQVGPNRIVAKVLRLSWTQLAVQAPTLPKQKPVDLFTSTPSASHNRSTPTNNGISELDLFS